MKPKQSAYFTLIIALLIISVFACKKDDKNEKQLLDLAHKFDSLAYEIKTYKDSLKKFDEAISNHCCPRKLFKKK